MDLGKRQKNRCCGWTGSGGMGTGRISRSGGGEGVGDTTGIEGHLGINVETYSSGNSEESMRVTLVSSLSNGGSRA